MWNKRPKYIEQKGDFASKIFSNLEGHILYFQAEVIFTWFLTCSRGVFVSSLGSLFTKIYDLQQDLAAYLAKLVKDSTGDLIIAPTCGRCRLERTTLVMLLEKFLLFYDD